MNSWIKLRTNAIQKLSKKGSLAQKLSIFVLTLLLIPITIIDIFSVSKAVNAVISESKKSYLIATNSTAQYFQILFETAKNAAIQIMSNDSIQSFCTGESQNLKDENEKAKIAQDAKKYYCKSCSYI
ncbi:hypothetical protein [Caldicellulosiruptor obsidiansis]|uniref:hypothetical protein n=1 Tax=Caldicellulosiruptor obsidiansis TaxID=717609 RepID=UPI0002DCE1BF|nr:hypothetical protein [Caldicellulosiruptor obsidiansis]